MRPSFRSLFLALVLASGLAARGAVVLSVDLNDAIDTPGDTAAGFTGYTIPAETLTIAPFTVDVNSTSGALLDDVHRTTPLTGGALTLGALYRDCIFAGASSDASKYFRVGLDTLIGGLTPGKKYTITAWSFDSGSAGARTSDWSVLGLGGPQFAVNNYTFDGATLPAADTANRFSVTAYADTSGRLTLRGRQNALAATTQVVLNGFTVDEQAAVAVEATTVLALDFNQRTTSGAVNTQSGFQEFLLNGSGAQSVATARAYGSVTATLTPIGSGIVTDDRNRASPANAAPFTESLLLQDFVFASTGAAGTTGMDLRLHGLTANHTYLVELWSFDSGSSGARTSDWTINGTFLWDDYVFNRDVPPTTNDDSKMVGAFTTDASGDLLISGRLVANGPAVFINAVRVSDLAPAPIVNLGHPILSEFLAQNANGITDEDGETSDWIEIWNTTASTLDLTGWRLTDDVTIPGKWVFPSGVLLNSQARLRVWASGKDRTANPAALHTSFALDKAVGAYLAFSKPDGTIVTSFTNLPSQREDISYGLSGTVEPLTAGYFQPPTPAAPNGTPVPGFVSDTVFDIGRGYYTTAQTVHITCATPGSQIYYTTDGSDPTAASTPYPGVAGISVTTTTVLRAKAFATPLSASNIDTHSYIFRAHVQNQPANPVGWPTTWGTNSEVALNNGGNGTVPADYEMDPVVVNATLPGYGVKEALEALPSLSIVMNPADFHNAATGIYTNPQTTGDAMERACSFEWIELDGTDLHTRCGIRVHGNSSRRPYRMQKHAFRLAFRTAYGDGKLNGKLFDDTTVKSFDKLVLHEFFTDGWGMVSWDPPRYRPDDSLYFRDPWMKKSFADMGHARVSGRFVHLYINGLYWGLYEVSERIDDNWCADHFGGLSTDYDVMGDFTDLKAGTSTAWDSLFTLVNSADFTQAANYNSVAAQVDLVDFVDYYLLHIHGDAEDWPHHNGYAYRNRNLAGAKWRFVVWDQEIIMDPTLNVDRFSNNATNTTTPKTAGNLYQKLKVNPEFKLLFADRAHKHLDHAGALSTAVEQVRWQGFANTLDKAIVAESARWGDTADATPYGNANPPAAGKVYTREADWLPSIAAVKNSHFANLHNTANSYATITELKTQGLYPNTAPPDFAPFGGNVVVNFALTITAPAGTIYYTKNGTDPREAVTGNAVGTLYSGPVMLTQTCTIKVRARNGSEWSALTEADFIVGVAASSANLAVTELNYAPVNALEEFVELTNFSGVAIDLTDVHFEGITLTIADGTLLAAGERVVLVRDSAAFIARYGNGPRIIGTYSGALDNNGEQFAMLAANGADIVRFIYNNKGPWPTAPANGSRTLVLNNPAANPQNEANWRSSVAQYGNPGTTDSRTFAGSPLADADRDGSCALLEFVYGTSDTAPDLNLQPTAAVENFMVNNVSTPFLTFTSRAAPGADAVAVSAELSTNATTWDGSAASVFYLGETIDAGGIATRKWRAVLPYPASGRQFFRFRAQLP